MSIGALSKATGIPTNTLRTWERRYGFPTAIRTASGHRLYDASLVGHLTLILQALDRGHRPAQVLPLDLDDLRSIVGERAVASSVPIDARGLDRWMAAASALDGEALDAAMAADLSALGLLPFLEQRAAPFLEAVGEAWEAGRFDVYHEHFASSRLCGFTGAAWRSLSARSDAPSAVLTTLPGEHHEGGLHMAAAMFALNGWRITYLGTDTPVNDIAACARNTHARVVAVSVSVAAESDVATRQLVTLRAALPGHVHLLAGGGGAPELERVLRFTDLRDLDAWIRHEA